MGYQKMREQKIMRGVWNLVKHNYVDEPDIDFLLKSINEDKSINPTTTSDKFKQMFGIFQRF